MKFLISLCSSLSLILWKKTTSSAKSSSLPRLESNIVFKSNSQKQPLEVFCKKGWHRCFPVNVSKFLRIPFSQYITVWLLLNSQCFESLLILNTEQQHIKNITLHKKRSFPLRISSVTVTKSPGNCGFGHIYWTNS